MISNFLTEIDDWHRKISRRLQKEDGEWGATGTFSENWKQHHAWSSPKYDKFKEVIVCGDEYKAALDIFFPEMYIIVVLLRVDAPDGERCRGYLQDITLHQQTFETEASKIKKKMDTLQHEIRKISAEAASDHHKVKDPEPSEVYKFVEHVNEMIEPKDFTDKSDRIKQQLQSLILHSSKPSHPTHPSATAPELHMTKLRMTNAVSYNFRTELIRFTKALLSTAFPPTPAVPFHSRPPPVSRGLRPPLPAAPFPAATCPALYALCVRVAHITAVSEEHPNLAAFRFQLELANRSALVRLARKEARNSLASAAPAARAALEKRVDALDACLSDSATRLVLASSRYGHEHVHLVRRDDSHKHEHNTEHRPPLESDDEIYPEEHEDLFRRSKVKTDSKLAMEIEFMKLFERELDDVANAKE